MYLQSTVPESCLSGTVVRCIIRLFYLPDCFQIKACCQTYILFCEFSCISHANNSFCNIQFPAWYIRELYLLCKVCCIFYHLLCTLFLYIICISFTKIQYGRKYIEPWCFTFTQKNPRQYYYQGCTAGDLLILSAYFFLTITLSRCQISSTYSWMVLSEVNLPLQAVLRRAFFAQPFSSLYASSTRFWASA